MRPAVLLLLFCLMCPPQGSDTDAVLQRDFSAKVLVETAPEGANGIEKAIWNVRKQLQGRDYYNPPNYMFFRLAVKKIGFVPAVFATLDRITRDSKIGTYQEHVTADHPYIEEGPEAYRP